MYILRIASWSIAGSPWLPVASGLPQQEELTRWIGKLKQLLLGLGWDQRWHCDLGSRELDKVSSTCRVQPRIRVGTGKTRELLTVKLGASTHKDLVLKKDRGYCNHQWRLRFQQQTWVKEVRPPHQHACNKVLRKDPELRDLLIKVTFPNKDHHLWLKDLWFCSWFWKVSKPRTTKELQAPAPRTVHRMTAKKEKWAQEGSEFTTSITRGDASKVWWLRGLVGQVGGFHSHGGTPIAGWFRREIPNLKWMWTGGSPSFQGTTIWWEKMWFPSIGLRSLKWIPTMSWLVVNHRSAWWNLWPPLMWMCCRV